jgi:hypothetical protein
MQQEGHPGYAEATAGETSREELTAERTMTVRTMVREIRERSVAR